MITDRFPQAFEPGARPCELNAQDGKANRDKHQCGAGCHDHYYSDNQHGYTYDGYDDASRHLVGNMKCPLDHQRSPSFLLRLAVALGQ